MNSKKKLSGEFGFMGSDSPGGQGEFISILPPDEEQENEDDKIPNKLPILPLRNTVLFPNTVIPITINREKSVKLISDAEKSDRKIGVVAQRSQDIDDPEPENIFEIGTVANIIKKIKLPDDNTMVIIQGITKFKIKNLVNTEPYLLAEIELKKAKKFKTNKRIEGMLSTMKDMAKQIINLSPNIPKEASIALDNIDVPMFLINFIASNLNIGVKEKQEILKIEDVPTKISLILKHLNQELEMLKIKNEIHSKVKTDLDKQQRDFFLQQQLKEIHEELGTSSPEKDFEDFKKRGKKKKWDKKTKELFDKELVKLHRTNPAAADYSVLANYVELLLDLPWNVYSKDNLDLDKAQKILDEDHYGLEKIKERILEYLSVIKMKGDMKSPILCLHGPPGVGKTSLGKSIARAMGRKYIRMSLGGLHDEAEIRGHRKTYIGAMPGRIIQSIKKAKTSNPVIVLDEIDKVGNDYKGDPASALLEVLDPEQNSTFYDNYLEMEFDLSHVMFVATANTLNTINPALRDRLEIIDLSGYLLDEKIQIAKKFLLPKQRKMHGLNTKHIMLNEQIISSVVEDYTRESGVRSLEKTIAKICRYQTKSFLSNSKDFIKNVNAEKLFKILGPKIFEKDTYKVDNFPGVVTGLAWTPVGGDVLFIEVNVAPGKGKLNLTGTLGDVMKESALLAYTYLKSHYQDFKIDSSAFENWDIHIHVPEGAVPKEGPSAGITILTALVSIFTQRKVNSKYAMTGELTLRGIVLPVGGIKEKILAAKRQGISDIILCASNRKNIEDINKKYLEGIKFHYVKMAKEVIDIALEKNKIKNPININNPEFAKKKKK
ncbi:MAG: endopeptidase La [Bacteroidota bacterium]|nr:endopeptidase La [Bacteroidota bacterium]